MRPDLFPADRLLVVRMVLAAIVSPLLVLGPLVAVLLAMPPTVSLAVLLAFAVGILAAVVRRRRAASAAVELAAPDAPGLHSAVERLCLAADIPKPRIVLEREAQPNCWITSVRRRDPARLHVTEGLLATLDGAELEAVMAHELAHVVQRDAAVMTIVGGPAAMLLGGGRDLADAGIFNTLRAGGALAFAVGWLGSLGTRVLSRARELSADAGAVALTGNPAALASALVKVGDGLAAVPKEDLRRAAARDAFHLLPAARRSYLLPATHPPLRVRIQRLERMEAHLQSARFAARVD